MEMEVVNVNVGNGDDCQNKSNFGMPDTAKDPSAKKGDIRQLNSIIWNIKNMVKKYYNYPPFFTNTAM